MRKIRRRKHRHSSCSMESTRRVFAVLLLVRCSHCWMLDKGASGEFHGPGHWKGSGPGTLTRSIMTKTMPGPQKGARSVPVDSINKVRLYLLWNREVTQSSALGKRTGPEEARWSLVFTGLCTLASPDMFIILMPCELAYPRRFQKTWQQSWHSSREQ